jgi:hypothetical protein
LKLDKTRLTSVTVIEDAKGLMALDIGSSKITENIFPI